jgi:hypothetical protein
MLRAVQVPRRPRPGPFAVTGEQLLPVVQADRDLFGGSTPIPVITLWQPWASLCFVADRGLRKCMETRGYAPPLKYVGGQIALHSAAAHPPAHHVTDTLNDLACHAFGSDWRRTLPLGKVLGLVTLSGGIPVEQIRDALSAVELVAGNYDDDRFAWPLADPQPFPVPIPAKGKQGWWSIEAAALTQVQP